MGEIDVPSAARVSVRAQPHCQHLSLASAQAGTLPVTVPTCETQQGQCHAQFSVKPLTTNEIFFYYLLSFFLDFLSCWLTQETTPRFS